MTMIILQEIKIWERIQMTDSNIAQVIDATIVSFHLRKSTKHHKIAMKCSKALAQI